MPDYTDPVVMTGTGIHTVEKFCNQLHKSIINEFKEANVWGTSVKYSPMKVGRDHVLNDEDVVQIIKRI
jgi:ribosome-interacting GTPase 1